MIWIKRLSFKFSVYVHALTHAHGQTLLWQLDSFKFLQVSNIWKIFAKLLTAVKTELLLKERNFLLTCLFLLIYLFSDIDLESIYLSQYDCFSLLWLYGKGKHLVTHGRLWPKCSRLQMEGIRRRREFLH